MGVNQPDDRLRPAEPFLKAATVVLLRDGPRSTTSSGRESVLECLMLRKTEGQAFGGMWVFPGGRIEETDGSDSDGARRAAVREAAEETGLLLEPDALVPMAYWIPPPDAPKRYLTWFFVAQLQDAAAPVMIDGAEIGDHVWTAPAAALAAHARGEITLLPPTWVTLHWLSQHGDVATLLRDASTRPVELFATRMARSEAGLVALWEPDVAYRGDGDGSEADTDPGTADLEVDLDAPGPRHRLYMDPAGWRYERT
jgi:8-oxo-dGTP pyrophosphatase MutT (NUDIX family)